MTLRDSPGSISIVEEWKRKDCEFSIQSDDKLGSVIAKGLDAIYRILKRSEYCDIKRTLESLDFELSLCLRYNEYKMESSIRSLIFGFIESLHVVLFHLTDRFGSQYDVSPVKEWKRKADESSSDFLAKVISRGLEAILVILESEENHVIQRALRTLDDTRSFFVRSENSKSLSIRTMTYALIQCTVLALRNLTDQFPILALPNELLCHIFSFLSLEDRLRARVNKKLNAIESESKYHVYTLLIEENSIERYEYDSDRRFDHRMTFYQEKSYSSDCVRKIARNVSVRWLKIKLPGSNEFHREIYNLIKEFDVDIIDAFEPLGNAMLNGMMDDSFFLELTRTCKKLELDKCENITAEALHQVYQNMMDGSTKFRELRLSDTSTAIIIEFLKLIGINYRDGRLFSTRDIKIDTSAHSHYHIIFDGRISICFGCDEKWTFFDMQFHEKAKNRKG